MKLASLQALLDRGSTILLVALFACLLLTDLHRGDFRAEAGIVMIMLLLVIAIDIGIRRRTQDPVFREEIASLDIHSRLGMMFGALATVLYIAKYTFGIDAIGFWILVPVLFFFVSGLFESGGAHPEKGPFADGAEAKLMLGLVAAMCIDALMTP
jgi:hypothetical protein